MERKSTVANMGWPEARRFFVFVLSGRKSERNCDYVEEHLIVICANHIVVVVVVMGEG